ncbi:MAG TPA: tRNA (N6-isopentenyl adenosine(37)-C2)-methylthiotransferase MiaB [Candidatus Acidoferrum sp.]|nr:tRNA (N6-isopentenyl adenosine(37)-C2)-methylthiotransferase MiaB [Candidatus Acidoferrum sp.]
MEHEVRRLLDAEAAATGRRRKALIETYGCQQNGADSDRMRGQLVAMGFDLAGAREDADLILFNTCAVREHAEQKLLGNLGALRHLKARRPGLVIAVTGCMMQQPHRVEEITKKYRHVDIVLGTNTFFKLPEAVHRAMTEGGRTAEIDGGSPDIPEDIPVARESGIRAWVTAMYGCNNFCSYCVVPYTRGRERSRPPEYIEEEVRGLVKAGYKDITLLGQNVNSYGWGFPKLLALLDAIEGDYLIRFMTSHPKDATPGLFEAMAASKHVARQLHLPVQSGSDAVLAAMNRRYTAEHYLGLAQKARELIPDLTLTSDIIVGFPGESEADFEATLDLIRTVRFDSLFTFAYSARRGTRAADMEGQIPAEVKKSRLIALMKTQQVISAEKNAALLGCVQRVLVMGRKGFLEGRTEGGKPCYFEGDDALIGSFVPVKITIAKSFVLYGELQ